MMQNYSNHSLGCFSSIFTCETCGFRRDVRDPAGAEEHLKSHSLYITGLRLLEKPGYLDRRNGSLKILKSFYHSSVYNADTNGFTGHPDFESYAYMVFDLCEEIPDHIKQCLAKDLRSTTREIEDGTLFWKPSSKKG